MLDSRSRPRPRPERETSLRSRSMWTSAGVLGHAVAQRAGADAAGEPAKEEPAGVAHRPIRRTFPATRTWRR